MTSESKKTTWISVGLVGLIFTALGIAYSAGIRTVDASYNFEKINNRIDFNEQRIIQIERQFKELVVQQRKDVDIIKIHLHRIDVNLTEQTTLLKNMKGTAYEKP